MKVGVRGALGLLLSAFLLWWVMKDTSPLAVWDLLSHSNLALWLASMVAATAIFPLRARRWEALLEPVAGRLPFRALWQSTAVGMMVNNVLPLRAGEFARAFALSRAESRVRFTAAFASLAIDRLFDGAVVLALMLVATLDPAFPTGRMIGEHPLGYYLKGASLFLGAVLVVLVALVLVPHVIFDAVDAVMRRVAPRHEPRLRALMDGFASGLDVLRSPRLLAEVFLWTLAHWTCNAFAFWLGFRALGIVAPFSAAFLVQGLVAIGVAAPAAPGYFGLFEYFGKAGLGLYGVGSAQAVSWVLGFHVLSYIPITVMGAWYLTRLHLHFRDFTGAREAAEPA